MESLTRTTLFDKEPSMAQVCLYRDEAERGDLPHVCINCGDPDVEFEERSFVWWPLAGTFIPLVRLVTARRMRAQLPFCPRHGGGLNLWAKNPRQLWGIRPTHLSEDTITIAGVCDEFADAVERYRDGEGLGARRPRRAGGGEDDRPRRGRAAEGPRARRPRPVGGTGWGGGTVLLILLGVFLGVPLLGCGGLIVLSVLSPRQRMPPPQAGPPADFRQQGNQPAPAALRPEDVAAAVAVAPNDFPANIPWGVVLPPGIPRPPADAEVAQALRGLKDPSTFTVRDAAQKLAKMAPAEKHRKEVAAELLAASTRARGPGAEAALQALAVWGTAEEVPALLARLENEHNPWSRAALMDTLGGIKDPRAAGPVAKRLGDLRDRDRAADVLKKLGTAAEQATLPHLKSNDRTARVKACEVLEAVGTADSEAGLRAAATDPDRRLAAAAQKALGAIKERRDKKPAEEAP
jgi:hypothetical protein